MIRCLYVDHDRKKALFFKKNLEINQDISIDVCRSSLEAMQELKNFSYDIIIFERDTEIISFFEFMNVVRLEFGDIPIIRVHSKRICGDRRRGTISSKNKSHSPNEDDNLFPEILRLIYLECDIRQKRKFDRS